MFTLQNIGSDDSVDSDANPSTGQTVTTFLSAGENETSFDAGLFQLAEISDFVWEDVNGNGVQDVGEAGIENVTVNLLTSWQCICHKHNNRCQWCLRFPKSTTW